MHDSLTLCDVTQSYAATGGGIRTYLTEKRRYIDQHTAHRHVLIVPGPEDKVIEDGRHITFEIASPKVPGSPMYRLLLRSKSVIRALRLYAPDFVECLDAYNLPWAALSFRKERPSTTLIAGYRTDFPSVYLEAPLRKRLGGWVSSRAERAGYRYASALYSRFDGMYALNANMAVKLTALGIPTVDQLPLGVDLDLFGPERRDEALRAKLGVAPDEPLLIYVGRIDREKDAPTVFNAFCQLPHDLGATLVMLGLGNQKESLEQRGRGRRIHFPGFVSDRAELATWLASSDLYVSAMAHETFGISIIEAQAAGLPVIGVHSGAMPDRVNDALGRLGPVGDPTAMAENIVEVWRNGLTPAMGAAARQHVLNHFSWAHTFEHLFGHIYPRARAVRQAEQAKLAAQASTTASQVTRADIAVLK